MLENRVLRKICGSKSDEVTMYWRKLHNEELSDLYSSPIIVRVIQFRRMRWAGRGEMYIGFLWVKLEGKRPHGKPRRRWEDNIKMDFQEVGSGAGSI